MNNTPILTCENLKKHFKDGEHLIEVLRGIDLQINQGEKLAVVGTSGTGKSTLLHLLAGLDQPTSGKIKYLNHDLTTLNEKQRCKLRNQKMGFIYQLHHLLPEFTALENTAMPLLIGGTNKKEANEKARHILNQVELSHRENHYPGTLSGGERQRVAIARALVNDPTCVFADEPTGNLDSKTAATIYELLINLNETLNTSLIVVTHDHKLASILGQITNLENGQLNPI